MSSEFKVFSPQHMDAATLKSQKHTYIKKISKILPDVDMPFWMAPSMTRKLQAISACYHRKNLSFSGTYSAVIYSKNTQILVTQMIFQKLN